MGAGMARTEEFGRWRSCARHLLEPLTPAITNKNLSLPPDMASNVFLRHSLAVAKRPLLPFQLGTSTSSASTHAPPTTNTARLLIPTINPPLRYILTHTQQTARRSTTNFAYVPGGRTSQLSHFCVSMTIMMMVDG